METNSAASALSGDNAAPAAAPAPAPDAAAPQNSAPAPAPAPASNDAWFTGIQNNDVRVWAEAKGFKDPMALAESAYNLEKLMGFSAVGRTIVVPDENATPEQIAAFREKIGVPTDISGYKLPVPEGDNGEFAKTASEWFHEAGVPASAAAKVAEKWNEFQSQLIQKQEQEFAANSEREFGDLKVEWGKAYDQNMELARRAATQFLPAKDAAERQQMLQAIERVTGTEKMLKFFANIGSGLGEHKLHSDGGGGSMTPAAAQQRIAELKSSPEWSSAYLSGDKSKAKELADLIAMAYPEG